MKPGPEGRVLPNPHDRFVKAVFGDPREARGLLAGALPGEVLACLDLDGLGVVPGSVVDETLAEHHTDLLYEVPLARPVSDEGASRSALVFVLLEHQSTPDPRMPLRLLGYILRIWERHARDRPASEGIPALVPMVLYHGRVPWHVARELHEQVVPAGSVAPLLPFVPGFRYVLHDLSRLADGELRGRALGQTALWLLRHAADGRLWDRMADWVELLAGVLRESGLRAVELVLRYALQIEDEVPTARARRVLEARLGQQGTEVMMSAAEKLRAEGRIEGHLEGRAEGHAEATRAMVLGLLAHRFGRIDDAVTARVQRADATQLDACAKRIVDGVDLEAALAPLD